MRNGYHCAVEIPKPHPQTRGVPLSRSTTLAQAINKYYLDCVNRSDLWADPGYVAQMIVAVYGKDEE